jgi:hypothetical protein
MPTAEAALARLRDPAAEVSAHYLVAEDGRIWRLVDEAARAWHAGVGRWGGSDDVNSRSIGIELANAGPLAGFPPFPEPQMAALEALLEAVRTRWSIPPVGVIAHSDLAPGARPIGPKFDWRRLARRAGGLAEPAGGRGLGGVPEAATAVATVLAGTGRRCWGGAVALRPGEGMEPISTSGRSCGRWPRCALRGTRGRVFGGARGWPDGRAPVVEESPTQGEMAAENRRGDPGSAMRRDRCEVSLNGGRKGGVEPTRRQQRRRYGVARQSKANRDRAGRGPGSPPERSGWLPDPGDGGPEEWPAARAVTASGWQPSAHARMDSVQFPERAGTIQL